MTRARPRGGCSRSTSIRAALPATFTILLSKGECLLSKGECECWGVMWGGELGGCQP